MSKTVHLISTVGLATELGIPIRVLRAGLDQLGCRPKLILDECPYFERSTVGKVARIVDELGKDSTRRPHRAKPSGI